MQTLGHRAHELTQQYRGALRRHPLALGAVTAVFTIVALLSLAGGLWFLPTLPRGFPDKDAIRRIGEMDQTTAVYDDADRLAFTIYKEQRLEVALVEVSPHLTQALIAIEDQRFYDHRGFDLFRMASAVVANIRHRRAAQGGSTITQQLARQSFLTPDKTLHRKVQELILAAQIERQYTKPEILELYLNKVYFGDGLYGVEAASRGYFAKHASELSVAEAALLAGLVKSPSAYAPTAHPERAVARRNVVLQAMLENGAIDRAMWQEARHSRLALHDGLRASEPYGQYFKEQVRLELVERFGWQSVYQAGLRVFSTINMPMQRAAEIAVDESLKVLDERRRVWKSGRLAARKNTPAGAAPRAPATDGRRLQAALVAMDPATGHVRAMIGGRDFKESRFNRAVQAHRQAGSAFKPFVYAAALEAGYTPATVINHLNDLIPTAQGAWAPEDEHSTAESMTLRTGLRTSSNRAAVRLLQQVGIPTTVRYVRDLGVGDVPSVPSLALGSGEVTLQSMTAAYAAFANRGLVPRPLLIRRVEDRDGRVLYEERDSSTRAVSETTAFLMTTMMADVVNAGTAAGARRLGFTLPAAGKTGTTNDFNDAWFVGFTPRLVAGVWVGFDQPQTILPRGFAADIAVPVWAKFMKVATRDDKPEWFTPPPGVTTATVCRLSGRLAMPGCGAVEVVGDDGEVSVRSMVYTEYFARRTDPVTFCDLHSLSGLVGVVDLPGHQDAPSAPAEVAAVPPRPAGAAVPPGPAVASVAPVPVTEPVSTSGEVPPPAPDASKKRGFWSKVFGIGKDDSKTEQTAPKKKGG